MLEIRRDELDDGIVEVDCGSWHIGNRPDAKISDHKQPKGYYVLRIRKKGERFEAYKRWHTNGVEEVAIAGTLEEVVGWVNSKYPSQSVKVVA